MKIFKMFKIAILIFFILGISRLDFELSNSLKVIPYIFYTLSLLLVLGFVFWAVKIKKIKLFLLPLFACLIFQAPAFAEKTPEIGENSVYFDTYA